MIEPLETRVLMSVTLVGRIVQITGTSKADTVTLGTSTGTLIVSESGKEAAQIPLADFDGIWVSVGAGNDFVNASGNDIPVTILGGDGNDTIYGSSGADVLVGGKGDDLIEGNGGNDTLAGSRGNDSLYGKNDVDVITGGGGIDQGQSNNNASTIDVENVLPPEVWKPIDDSNYANVLTDVRVKFVEGRGYVAVLALNYGSSGYRETVSDIRRDGNTFHVTLGVEYYTGGTFQVLTQHLKTTTLSHTLPNGSFQVIINSPEGTIVGRQRFTSSPAPRFVLF